MVVLYVAGARVGPLPEHAELLGEMVRAGERIELRDESGNRLGRFVPDDEPLVPWDPTITKEEVERRLAGPAMPLDEWKKRMGWE